MAPEQKELLSLRALPARLNLAQVAWVLGFREHDLPVLVASGLLKPLGNPPLNGVRFFAAADIERLKVDSPWLHRATACIYRHWQHKNGRRRERPSCQAGRRAPKPRPAQAVVPDAL